MSTDTAAQAVLLEETHGNVRLLRLNRPAKKNALSSELMFALINAVNTANTDSAVRVIGITGVGDTFCAGADLSPAKNKERGVDTVETVVQLVTGIRVKCHKPVIAGINGLAIGAGLSLAMCCDIRMASDTASFHPGYARAGTSPDCGLTWSLPQAIGHERAMRFLLEVDFINAEQAMAMGMIGDVKAAARFEESFLSYCQKISEVAPLAATQTKCQLVEADMPDDLEALLRSELRYTGKGLASKDGKEAVRAIFQKRKPIFTGN